MGTRPSAHISIFAVGVCGLIAQVVVLREMVVTFYGNELSVGVMLGSWLLWTGLGSLGLGRLVPRGAGRRWLAGAMLAAALVLVATVVGARCLKIVLGLGRPVVADYAAHPLHVLGELAGLVASPSATLAHLADARAVSAGQLRPFGLMVASSLVLLGPFCLVNGLLFPLGCAVLERMEGEGGVGRAYLLEAAGAAVGGAAYSFALVHWVNPLALATGLAGALCVCAAALSVGDSRGRGGRVLLGIAGCGAVLVASAFATGWPGRLAGAIEHAYWRPRGLVATMESRYGRVDVVRPAAESEQRSLYYNGALAFSYPDAPVAEDIAHLPMLEHPAPRRVLVIGGGLGGVVEEVLEHPSVEGVTCVELDPVVVRAVSRHFAESAARGLRDPRVRLAVVDGRVFLKETAERYDVVIAAEAPPTTAQANRYYTLEFFREVARVLEPGGVFAFRATGTHNYALEEIQHLLACLHRTLAEAFPHVVVFPGPESTLLASNQPGVVSHRLDLLDERMRERGLRPAYVDAAVWDSRLMGGRLEELEAALAERPALNRDLAPRCYYYEARRWSAQQRVRGPEARIGWLDLGRLLKFLDGRPAVAPLVLLAVVAVLALAAPLSRRRWRDGAVAFSVASTGLIEMAVEFTVLLGFQVVYGYMYHYVGVLVASFMCGLALGAWASGRAVQRGHGTWRRMLAVQACICAYPLVLLGFLTVATRLSLAAFPALAAVLFSGVALAAGLAGGLQFPLAVSLHSAGTRSAGTLYGLDLLGSCLGAVAVSSLLVPSLGLGGVCVLLALLGALGLAALLAAGRVGDARPQ